MLCTRLRRCCESTISIPKSPIADESNWIASTIDGESRWIFRLEARELDALAEPGTSSACSSSRLFALSEKIAQIHHELEFGRGIVLIKGLDAEQLDF